MNRLAALLTVDDVWVDVEAENPLTLFVQAGLLIERHRWSGALGDLTDALTARERLGSTALGHGVAIPHARLKGLNVPMAVVIRLRAGLSFGGPDREPTCLFVFLFVPQLAGQTHLDLLAEIAEMMADRTTRERLKEERSAGGVLSAIAAWSPGGFPSLPDRASGLRSC